jgi:multiple sugar transport system permease protein
MTRRARTTLLAYGLLAPAFLITVSMMIYPLFITASLSLRAGNVMSFSKIRQVPISAKNYVDVFTAVETWRSLALSLIYTGASNFFSFFLGLATALLLNRLRIARRLMRILVLVPWSVPGVVASISFLWILDSSYGVFNYMLRSAGLISANLAWFFDPRLAMVSVIMPTVWKGYPFFTLTLLAALQTIPEALLEAGRVDGCSPPQMFRHITWPAIRSAAVLAIVLNALWTFRVFDIIYPTTQGGPMGATETLAIRIYNEAFRFFYMGRAATLGILTFLVCGLFVLAQYPFMKKKFF